VMVFARSYGNQNKQAKEVLKLISKETTTPVEFLDLDLMGGWDGSLILLYLEEMTGQWALPNIFIGGQHVGGNTEIDQMHALGELEEMVRKAGQEL
jgi:glutaredoxin 3